MKHNQWPKNSLDFTLDFLAIKNEKKIMQIFSMVLKSVTKQQYE